MREENDRLAASYFDQTEIESWADYKKKYASKAFLEFYAELRRREKELLAQGIIED